MAYRKTFPSPLRKTTALFCPVIFIIGSIEPLVVQTIVVVIPPSLV